MPHYIYRQLLASEAILSPSRPQFWVPDVLTHYYVAPTPRLRVGREYSRPTNAYHPYVDYLTPPSLLRLAIPSRRARVDRVGGVSSTAGAFTPCTAKRRNILLIAGTVRGDSRGTRLRSLPRRGGRSSQATQALSTARGFNRGHVGARYRRRYLGHRLRLIHRYPVEYDRLYVGE